MTVAQFAAFVAAGGHKLEYPDALRAPGNQPVVDVSWHEARAYCEWLTRQLVALPAFADHAFARHLRTEGLHADLPSELEWEKAGRAGLPGAIFPWGDAPDPERANTHESGIDCVCAVGSFPATGPGLYDMVGNVVEWTGSAWTEDHALHVSKSRGDSERVVVRGGAFGNDPDDARCAWRHGDPPGARNYYLGFRVVLRWAPVLDAPAAGPSGL